MRQAWRLALRDLRAGGRGLRLLVLCLFVGTAALAGIGSLSASIIAALEAQGRETLGGDVELRVSQRRATVEEGAAFARWGRVSEVISTRSMAARPGGGGSTLVQLKAVDRAWPLVGRLIVQPGALRARPEGRQALIAPALADRLGLKPGDTMRLGAARMTVAGLIAAEPGALGQGFSFGPTVLVDQAGLDATDTIQPGSLYESRYRILLRPGLDAEEVRRQAAVRFPSAGWIVRSPADATNNIRRGISQLGQFLLLVGLAALAIAGVGVGSGVSAYLAGKTRMVATLKVLGARSSTIAALFLIELGLVALGGIGAGLGLGAAVPAGVAALAGDALPVPPQVGVYPRPLAIAAGLGLLVALLFALPALARAKAVPAAALLRGAMLPLPRPQPAVLGAMLALGAALAALAVLTASDRLIALGFVAATGGLLLALWLLGLALRRGLRRLPAPRRPLLRLALANLHRPGAATERLVVALGLGFSLFVALAAIDTSLGAELRGAAPAKAPRFFALDVQPEDLARFRSTVTAAAPGAKFETAPSLRGAIVALGGVRVTDMKAPPDSWLLRGDRTITWSAAVPPRNEVVAGRWWPPSYRGPPLVSLEDGAATALGLKVGDTITVAVLGVEVPARIAALRKVDWGGLGLNFALVFSPGYIEEAPHSVLATIYAAPGRDGAIANAVAAALPSVTMMRTGDLIGELGELLGRIAIAIRAAASVTVAAGIVVLVGAVAATGQSRRYDTVVLKMLGADRRQLLSGQAIEFGLLAALLAAVALLVGGAGGWYVVTRALAIDWAPDPTVIALTLAAAVLATLAIGMAGSLPALAARPAESLRAL
jgi:putative ABC transport system permease protein